MLKKEKSVDMMEASCRMMTVVPSAAAALKWARAKAPASTGSTPAPITLFWMECQLLAMSLDVAFACLPMSAAEMINKRIPAKEKHRCAAIKNLSSL